MAAAIAAARKDDLSLAYALRSEKALPYFEEYIDDPSESVRDVVADVASVVHSAEGVRVLIHLTADKNDRVSVYAAHALYEDFDKPLLKQTDGNKLKANLLLLLNGDHSDLSANLVFFLRSDVVFLFTSFPHDTDVLDALTEQHQGNNNDNTKKQSLNPTDTLYIDMALSELGQMDALNRIQTIIKRGDLSLLPVLLEKLKFVDNPTTLKSLVSLLRDKRFTKSGHIIFVDPPLLLLPPGQDPVEYRRMHPVPPAPGPRTYYYRVCDIALLRLAERTGVDIGIPDVMAGIRQHNSTSGLRNYTDAELDLAYTRLSAYFQGKTSAN